jgi:hypothetical protein
MSGRGFTGGCDYNHMIRGSPVFSACFSSLFFAGEGNIHVWRTGFVQLAREVKSTLSRTRE